MQQRFFNGNNFLAIYKNKGELTYLDTKQFIPLQSGWYVLTVNDRGEVYDDTPFGPFSSRNKAIRKVMKAETKNEIRRAKEALE